MSALGPAFDQEGCEWCEWRGPRSEREVNFSHAAGLWLCRVCFFRRAA